MTRTATSKAMWLCGTALASMSGTLLMTAGQAHAVPTYAYATIEFSNLALTGVLNGVGTVINSQVIVTDSAKYPGSAASGNNSSGGSLLTGASVGQAYSGPGPVPSAGYGQELGPFSTPPGDGGTRSLASISGAISGPATSQEVSEGYIPSAGTANSNTNTTTTIDIKFAAGADQQIKLTFNATAFEYVSIGQNGDAATASTDATYTIVGPTGAVVFNAAAANPAGVAALNNSLNLNNPGRSPETYTLASTAYAFTYTTPAVGGAGT